MPYFKLPLIAALVLLATACCSNFSTPDIASTAVANKPACGLTKQMRELLVLHNKIRQNGYACGNNVNGERAELVWNCQLHGIALKHTRDMLSSGLLSHRSSNGDGLTERLDRSDYGWRAAAENVSSGYVDASSVTQAWLGSREHCRNMLSADYQEIGAARLGDYWTVVFASPN